ncbi:hypothetical protein [Synechococcus sp. GFB01]|uniref:hypothetical protein n=1 Tax=Synechococcus sp. GFB01 TaxID=1662190 RepID=UPI00064F1347|nr:hypothetical protein [Synechococcus sp. GFB01]KMM17587.1 hypothetical protein SYNGFB01_03170 [Synechococcus sp. GFB01]
MNRRLAVLAALTGWAALLSVESWFRPAGLSLQGGLPDRLEWLGRSYRRVGGPPPSASLAKRLPRSFLVLDASDYRSIAASDAGRSGAPTDLRLELLVSTRSGWSGAIPVDQIARSGSERAQSGRCVILDESFRVKQELRSSEEWQRFHGPGPSAGTNPLVWLAGLRPYRVNSCLWLEAPAES